MSYYSNAVAWKNNGIESNFTIVLLLTSVEKDGYFCTVSVKDQRPHFGNIVFKPLEKKGMDKNFKLTLGSVKQNYKKYYDIFP